MRTNQSYNKVVDFEQQPEVTSNPNYSAQSSGPLPLQSMDSMQSMGSSSSVIQTASKQQLNQTFQVIYNNTSIIVDQKCLMNSSAKFKELISPYVESGQYNIHLEILTQDFSIRCINNFFRLCQNLPTDVQNSEMKEMCEIARLFKADQIYNTGVSFVNNTIDPNFSIPSNKYDSNSYLVIKKNSETSNGTHDLNEFEFEDEDKHDANKPNANSANKHDMKDLEFDEGDTAEKHDKVIIGEPPVDNELLDEDQSKIKKAKFGAIIYQIKVENRPLKPTIYQFSSNGRILFTAKHKENNIYIAEGTEVHIKRDSENHACQIHQNDDDFNLIHMDNQEFRLNYVKSGKPNTYSVEVKFEHDGQTLTWSPKPPKYDAMSNKYYLNFRGEYHRTAMRSKRNIVLQNPEGRRTFIVRKMELYLYEVECSPVIKPLIIFAIALSDIVGPYLDPFANIELPSK